MSHSFSLSPTQPAALSALHSFTHSLGVPSVILSLFRSHPAALSFSLSLFHPFTRCSVSESFTLSPTQPAALSVFHSFNYSAFFHALSQVTGHPVSHAITTCVIAITVTIGTTALIAAAFRQFDTAPNRYSNKNPRCTNVPATEPLLRYIIMQFTFRTNRNIF